MKKKMSPHQKEQLIKQVAEAFADGRNEEYRAIAAEMREVAMLSLKL